MNQFVPSHLGFSHITQEEVIRNHTRPLAQSLFGDNTQAIIVFDGTYIFIEKSNNFVFQRRSYSMHKGRPLVKPMVIVTMKCKSASAFFLFFLMFKLCEYG
jgi:hypothetical protein